MRAEPRQRGRISLSQEATSQAFTCAINQRIVQKSTGKNYVMKIQEAVLTRALRASSPQCPRAGPSNTRFEISASQPPPPRRGCASPRSTQSDPTANAIYPTSPERTPGEEGEKRENESKRALVTEGGHKRG